MSARALKAILALVLGLAFYTQAGSAEPDPLAFDKLQASARDLPALAQLALFERELKNADPRVQNWAAQSLAALRNQVGDYQGAIETYPFGPIHGARGAVTADATWTSEDAVTAITRLARDRQLVMINEAHHVGQTRVLTLALLPKLRALGFTHFAMEALSPTDAQLSERGYPTSASGNYVREPIMGEMVRTALALGFELIAYETAGGRVSMEQREAAQARQLFDRSFKRDPKARVFIHAGYAHVHERAGYLMKVEPLAMQIRALSGIDPMTIDQTLLRPDLPQREVAAYRPSLALSEGRAASVLMDRDGHAVSLQPGYVDVSVLLDDPPAQFGRAGWLAELPGRQAYAIPEDLCAKIRPCLVEARLIAESEEAVKQDRWILQSDAPAGHLLLRPGRYELSATGPAGGIESRTIEIAAGQSNP